MKALVVYESMFGNTEAIARAVAAELQSALDVTVAEARDIPSAVGVDLLVVGAPTHAFGLSRPGTREDAVRQGSARPADLGIREYLDVSPMLNCTAAAFDTRVDKPRLPGSAAHRAHRRLRGLGCRLPITPASFRVSGTRGPLLPGETDRAHEWARRLAAAVLMAKEASGRG
ncbi:flavodoxin family protein [Paractinoplanes hotanensis]|uniref:Flavodoxin domain-containing protein n=1 Tax=Paractinoplanes hotanensis TaxID=2906497 RepID=A0ABT0YH58_9ACTN|nr:flavodoxin domain-containing protein [Actinoplanes hotanensis]MCM4084843.1 flavodoxin domain-containing protein [Actinoplanes hotanensis]